ncbi:MAG: O-methyltransferase [Chitinophagaceae bacterium]|nr:MAG: O-methyltransferase [Chitinophagaceae bacterium]
MEIINPQIQSYAEKYSSPEDDLLKELAAFTKANHPEHNMISGHLQGKLLTMFSCMIQPKRILEIGTLTGYSALCLAKGLTENGKIHTIELRGKDAGIAQNYFNRSELCTKIILHIGDATEIIPKLNDVWDLVFLDADKTGYINYFELVFPQLKKNGFFVADNTLFHGQVLEQSPKGKNAKAIQKFNEYILNRNDVEVVMLSVRDGLTLIQKM